MNTKIITFCVFATLFMGAYVALCCFQPDKANPVLVLSIAFAVVAVLCVLLDSCKGCRIVLCCRKNLKELEGKIDQQESRITTQESQIADAKKAVEEKILPIGQVSDDEVRKHNDELRDLLGKFEGMGKTLTEIKTSIDDVKAELGKLKLQ
jgi:cell division protein FtsL